MKYYLDTEFHEYKKVIIEQERGHGYHTEHKHEIDTIELISIGIVSEDNRELYLICKEFDIQAAWDNEW